AMWARSSAKLIVAQLSRLGSGLMSLTLLEPISPALTFPCPRCHPPIPRLHSSPASPALPSLNRHRRSSLVASKLCCSAARTTAEHHHLEGDVMADFVPEIISSLDAWLTGFGRVMLRLGAMMFLSYLLTMVATLTVATLRTRVVALAARMWRGLAHNAASPSPSIDNASRGVGSRV